MTWMRSPLPLLALSALLLGLLASPVCGADGDEQDDWFAIYVGGQKSGYLHATVRRQEEEGRVLWVSEGEMHLALSRLGVAIEIRQTTRVEEDEDGRVVRFHSRSEAGGDPQVSEGRVEGSQIHMRVMGNEMTVAYPEGALGPVAADRAFRAEGIRTGASMELVVFSIDAPGRRITSRLEVGEQEEVDVLGRPRRLYRVTAENDLLPLPVLGWVTAEGRPVVQELNLGFATLRMLLTEERFARSPSDPAEVFVETLVRPDRAIPSPRNLQRAVYRLRTPGTAPPEIYEGEGQKVLARDEGALEVEVDAVPPEPEEVFTLPVVSEVLTSYLEPGPFVESDDPQVRALAEDAVGAERDARVAARRIEAFVRDAIQEKNLNVGFATAAEVARTREGDCTEHAVLCCALARAVGLPARVVTGLVYLPPEPGVEVLGETGVFGYHLWTEVLVADGTWLPIDAAIGSHDATHLALAKSDLASASPALDMVLATLEWMQGLRIEVVEPR